MCVCVLPVQSCESRPCAELWFTLTSRSAAATPNTNRRARELGASRGARPASALVSAARISSELPGASEPRRLQGVAKPVQRWLGAVGESEASLLCLGRTDWSSVNRLEFTLNGDRLSAEAKQVHSVWTELIGVHPERSVSAGSEIIGRPLSLRQALESSRRFRDELSEICGWTAREQKHGMSRHVRSRAHESAAAGEPPQRRGGLN